MGQWYPGAASLIFPPTHFRYVLVAQSQNWPGQEDGVDAIEVYETQADQAPLVNAGPDIMIETKDQAATVICGQASDLEGDPLTYRWLEGDIVLLDWQEVGLEGQACLNLGLVPGFSVGSHTLTLEVTGNEVAVTDEMVLSVNNSPPNVVPSGGGTYQVNAPVILGGQVSDFDGDLLIYKWVADGAVLFEGEISPPPGGEPVNLPEFARNDFSLGVHEVSLMVNDGINSPVTKLITIEVIDTTAPTIAPTANLGILWPPNHQMKDIIIQANAKDNSGMPVELGATISSNEPIDGLGDGDVAPDWTEPVIDNADGLISFQLRAERAGSGNGREYTIMITATDDSGNSSQASVVIIVPHDSKKK